MLDRLFMPALTFTLLVAAMVAFAVEFSTGHVADHAIQAQEDVVTLERVVVTAPAPALTLAAREAAADATATH